jgi:hypothetical protein
MNNEIDNTCNLAAIMTGKAVPILAIGQLIVLAQKRSLHLCSSQKTFVWDVQSIVQAFHHLQT